MDSAFPAGLRNLMSLIVNQEGKKATREVKKLITHMKQTRRDVAAGDSSEVGI